jgi:DNA adenine methylase
MWTVIRDHYDDLAAHIQEFKSGYDALEDMEAKRERYYWFRNEFNACPLSIRHAALFLTLNRTAFNALVRYNGKGNFNSAFGKRKVVAIDLCSIARLHRALNSADVTFQCGDFSQIETTRLGTGDFIYLDPPYHVLGTRKIDDKTYSKEGFVDADEQRLRVFCDQLDSAGATFLMSNHECPEILEYFHGYPYEKVVCYKSFTGKASSRSETKEILLGNGLAPIKT